MDAPTGGKSQTKPKKKPNAQKAPSPALAPSQGTATPAKPVQIYAGPTFHASPAPSALPIPKMFSKSMPQVNDKEASLRNMMQNDASGESSEEAVEGSPTLRSSVRVHAPAHIIREESPLDVFFRADKEEKARKNLTASSQGSLATPPPIARRAQSSSPGPSSGSGSGYARPASSNLEDSPSVNPLDRRAADAKAKTEALKNLLRFQGGAPGPRPTSSTQSLASSQGSTPPRPSFALERSASDNLVPADDFRKQPYPYPAHAGPRPNPRQASQLRQQLDHASNERLPSGTASLRRLQHPTPPPGSAPITHHSPPSYAYQRPTPPPGYNSSSGYSHPAHYFAAYQNQTPPPHPAGYRPSSGSSLTFGVPEALQAAQGSATPPRPNQQRPNSSYSTPPPPPNNLPRAVASNPTPPPGSHNADGAASNNNAAMEEQLRRILKLDGLPSQGVQS